LTTQPDTSELLRKGIEAARAGDKAAARALFEQVVDLDEKSEKGWFWLASVVDSDDERRICLANVLHINPTNERAQKALDLLEAKERQRVEAEEVVPGVTRRQFTLFLGGGVLLVILLIVAALIVTINNRNRIEAENAAATALSVASTATSAQGTAIADAATATAAALYGTQTATITPPSPTPLIATLPPTWTATADTRSAEVRATLPPPVGLTGRLAVWGGQNLSGTEYLPLGYYDLEAGNRYFPIADQLGRDITLFLNGQRAIYTRYDPLLFSTVIEAVNLNGTQLEAIQERWRGVTILDPEMPSYSSDGQSVVFVGKPEDTPASQVFLLSLTAEPGAGAVRRLTEDNLEYRYPVLSPDGSRVAVVRTDNVTAATGTDIVIIDLNTGGKFPLTNDLRTYEETTPFWSPDGLSVIYAAAPSNDLPDRDIYRRTADGLGTPQTLISDPADDVHPVMSGDGRYIAFASNRSGAYDIFIYDTVGAELFQLTDSNDHDYPGDWWQP
jgi:hypothetical protein